MKKKLSDKLCPVCKPVFLAHLAAAAKAGGLAKSARKTAALKANAVKGGAARWAGHVRAD
jgi:hypothetical protein